MNLADIRFFTDENIDAAVVTYLRQRGHDVYDCKESGLWGLPDHEILSLALAAQRFVLTQDSDFDTLIYRDEHPFYGIMYLRPGHFNPTYHIETLQYVLDADLVVDPPCLLVVERTETGVRIRVRQVMS